VRLNKDLSVVLVMLGVLLALPIFFHGDPYVMHIIIMSLIWGGLVIPWDLMMGYAGVFTFAQFAFFVFGGYATAMLTVYLGISPWLGIFLGGCVASVVGLILGIICLKLKGDYVALVTFAFHMILVPLFRSGEEFGIPTGGPIGIMGIPPLAVGGFIFPPIDKVPWYYTAIGLAFIVVFAVYKVIHSSFGLAFVSLRDAPAFSQSIGISAYKYKLIVFVIAAFLTGIMGAFYAHYAGIMSPRILGLDIFLIVMVMLVIGGIGKFPGVMIGAFIVTFLSEFSRPLGVYRLVMFGAIVVTSVVLMPEGIMKAVDLVSPAMARFMERKMGQFKSKRPFA